MTAPRYSPKMTGLLSVVVPAYNEASTIETVIQILRKHPLVKEIIVVDDGSTDATGELVTKWPDDVLLLQHEVNRGKGRAVRTGLAHATGDFLIIQDADLEYDPHDFEALLQPLLRGEADVVYGSRYLKSDGGKRKHGRFFDWGVALLNVFTRLIYGVRTTDEATCYKLFRTTDLRRMELTCERFEFCPEVTAKLGILGLRLAEVPISYAPRSHAGGKKLRWVDGIEAVKTLWRHRRWRPICNNFESDCRGLNKSVISAGFVALPHAVNSDIGRSNEIEQLKTTSRHNSLETNETIERSSWDGQYGQPLPPLMGQDP